MLIPQASLRYLPIQKAEATQLMHDLIKTPEVYMNSVYISSIFPHFLIEFLHPLATILNLRYSFCPLRQALSSVRNKGGNRFFRGSTSLGTCHGTRISTTYRSATCSEIHSRAMGTLENGMR